MNKNKAKELIEKANKWQHLKDSLDTVVVLSFYHQSKRRVVVKVQVFFYLTVVYKVTFNNVFGIITTTNGHPVYTLSAGLLHYKNSKKTTDLALRAIVQTLTDKIKNFGFSVLHLKLNCHGSQLRTFMFELKKFLTKHKVCLLFWVEARTFLPLNGTKGPRRVL